MGNACERQRPVHCAWVVAASGSPTTFRKTDALGEALDWKVKGGGDQKEQTLLYSHMLHMHTKRSRHRNVFSQETDKNPRFAFVCLAQSCMKETDTYVDGECRPEATAMFAATAAPSSIATTQTADIDDTCPIGQYRTSR